MSYQQQAGTGEDPGKTLGIVGLILAFVFAPAGIIVSYMGKKKSAEAGFDNGLAKIGFILSIIFTVLGVIVWIIYIALFASIMATA
ncbi:hypothetical protein ACQBAU_00820 [Propionibacteriaceae bacterium Y2011]|uniref:hypothetical protein n=1 Tax=Microlunatus sp. Y2014 TaxID=3418488 RepID=UPI003B48267F